MSSIIYWNVRGACGPKLVRNLRLICKRVSPCMIVISETKWVDESRSDCLKSLGFDGVVSVPSVGRSGGIAAAWRSDQIDAVLCRRDRQFLHFRCCLNGGDPFFLTPIYSIPDGTHKHLLQSALEDFASKISIP
ncbi:hypothetical protein K1719_013682 [Acacia pycnantha]|nr:hypothetical protein K1719_013682 [Acacia pycnantha]